MKKIFTLLAAMFICSSAMFAQEEEEPQEEGQFTSFWCHEWRTMDSQTDGAAEIVVDPTDPTNHCAKVYIRSSEEAEAAGNMITMQENGADVLAGWDSQFFIYSETALAEGMELRLVMRVRADKPMSAGTQCHNMPGDYNHWDCFGSVEFTTEWKKFDKTITITADMCQTANGKEFHSIAFNLADFREGTTAYFDDIKLYMREKPQGGDPQELTGWFNLLPQGTNTDFTFNGGAYHTFTGRDGMDGRDLQARIVNDPLDGEPALNVTSVGFNATVQVPIVDSETGEPFLDENGNPETEEKQVWVKYGEEKNDTITSIDNWQTQFFVTVPHKFGTGQRYKLRMWARADKPANVETQAHLMPGGYKHWDMVGSLALTDEWQLFVFGDEDYIEGDIRTISNEQSTCQTIAFNCNVLKEVNNYYFRFEDFSFNDADVTIEERTLGTEDITISVPEPGETPATTIVDFTNCVNVLGVEPDYFTEFIEDGSMTVQRKPISASDQEDKDAGWESLVPKGNMEANESEEGGEEGGEENMEVQYEPELCAATGFTLNYKGLYDEDGSMDFEVPEGYTMDAVSFNIYNNEESFKNKSAEGVFFFSKDGWSYRFNVTFQGEKEIVSKKGDVNEDGNVDISDIVAIINQIAGTAEYANADVNEDGNVDISDIVAVINIIAGE